jgi:hypothetical protein
VRKNSLILLVLLALGAFAGIRAAASAPDPPAVMTVVERFHSTEGLSAPALRMALEAMTCARARGVAGRSDLLTLIDYSLPSTAPRLWVLDLERGKVLFNELVAHGVGSGDNFATRFSNTYDSRQSSVGLFRTGGTYEGGHGFSLKLEGLDAPLNGLAEVRNIVIHGAWYVSREHAQRYGRLGRSWGCPALPEDSARAVIEAIKGRTFVFVYSADAAAFKDSSLRGCPAEARLRERPDASRQTGPPPPDRRGAAAPFRR